LELIEKKVEAGDKKLPAAKKTPRPTTNVIDLVDVLQRSLQETSKHAHKKTAAASSKTKRKKAA
jgi:non-homologous end joining protein Ku